MKIQQKKYKLDEGAYNLVSSYFTSGIKIDT